MTDTRDWNEHLYRKSWCRNCVWKGSLSELLIGSRPDDPHCPKCGQDDIHIGERMSDFQRLSNLENALKEDR